MLDNETTNVLELLVLTVSAYCPSLEGRIITLPSRLCLMRKLAASSRVHSMNQLHHTERCKWHERAMTSYFGEVFYVYRILMKTATSNLQKRLTPVSYSKP